MSWEAWGDPPDPPELPDGWLDEDQANELHHALAESLKLQSHYAELLNGYDGGKRMTFATPEEWLARLNSLEKSNG